MRFALIALSLIVIVSCSKSKKTITSNTPVYTAEYEYPTVNLNVGDGSVLVAATGIKRCLDQEGKEVSISLCPSVSSAPDKTILSPAGTITVSVPGAIGGSVQLPVAEGENYLNIPQTEVDNRISNVVSCDVGYVKVGPACVIPGYELYFSSYTTPSISGVCSGSETLTRTTLGCRDNITLSAVNISNCNGQTDPAPTTLYQSPAGTRTRTVGTDTIAESCAIGATAWVQTDITCGNPDQSKQGSGAGATCVDDTFVASDFTYPANTLTPGQGSLVVDATGFDTCTNTTKSIVVDNSKCSLPSTLPTTTYLSPAGTRNVVSGVNTIQESCPEGSAACTQTDITCGNPDQSKQGSGAGATCVDDTFVASDFTFPVNTLTPGQGSLVVNATGFNTCTNTTKSIVVDNSKCSLPSTLPTTTYLSPAGNYSSPVTGATGGVALVPVAEGESWTSLSESEQLSRISSVLVCDSGYVKIGAVCLGGVAKIVAGSSHTCVLLKSGEVKCAGHNYVGQLGVATNYNSAGYVYTPETVTGFGVARDITANDSATCAIAMDDTVKCAGINQFGNLGNTEANGSTNGYYQPRLMNVGALVREVYLGPTHSCVKVKDSEASPNNNTVRCFGSNQYGQISSAVTVGTQANPSPVDLTSLLGKVTMLSLGTQSSCALLENGSVKCFGSNQYGQLGNSTNIGTTTANPTPALVSGLLPVIKISSGTRHVCAQIFDDRLYCWGLNWQGALGVAGNFGTLTGTPTPQLSYSDPVKDFSASSYGHTCVITKDGSVPSNDGLLRCVGNSAQYQLGRTGTANSNLWETVSIVDKVKTVQLGWYHTCYLTEEDEPYCFGGNTAGQLGVGDGVPGPTPRPYLYK